MLAGDEVKEDQMNIADDNPETKKRTTNVSEHPSSHVIPPAPIHIDKLMNVAIVQNDTSPNTGNSLIVDFDQQQCKFTFYDKTKNLLGSFSSKQIIKYVTSKISTAFLSGIDASSSYNIIETYICKIIDKDGSLKIELLSHTISPFMGNIDMMMKLYTGIHKFESTQLQQELRDTFPSDSDTTKIQKKIHGIIKQLIYLILNHSLKLIATISDVTRGDPVKKEMRDTLTKYSVAIVHKISSFMKDEIENKINDYKLLQDDLVRMGKVKLEMYKKIALLENNIADQNKQIKLVLEKIELGGSTPSNVLYGGKSNISSASTASASASTSSSTTTVVSKSSTETETDTNSEKSDFNSSCYYTESGNEISNINYLTSSHSQKDSHVSDIQNLKSLV